MALQQCTERDKLHLQYNVVASALVLTFITQLLIKKIKVQTVHLTKVLYSY